MRSFSSFRVIRVSLALAVALWMAGAGCLLGCENMVATAATTSEQPSTSAALVVSGDACASAHSAHCCAKMSAKTKSSATARPAKLTTANSAVRNREEISNEVQSPAFNSNPPAMIDCPLAVNATAVLAKVGSDHANLALVSTNVNQLSEDRFEQSAPLISPLRLPNRGHTYLRCCVFLI